MSPRTVEENGVTFQIDEELGWSADTDPEIESELAEISYITTGVAGNEVDSFQLQAANLVFSGAVTPTQGDPAEIEKWQLGIVQNVTEYNRVAQYANGYTLTERFQTGPASGPEMWIPPPPPLRDGEPGGIPFYQMGAELTLNEKTSIDPDSSSDAPKWVIPQKMEDGSELVSTSGENTFATWLMLARIVDPPEERKIILLGRILWRVTWATNGTPPVFTGSVTQIDELSTGLAQVYTRMTLPVLGDGNTVPDLRVDVEGNDYVMGTLAQEVVVREWSYDDDDMAIPFKQASNPNDSPNWLLEVLAPESAAVLVQRTPRTPGAVTGEGGTVANIKVPANKLWVDTGLMVDDDLPVSVKVKSGQWTANPATGMVGAEGHDGLIAKQGYNLPGQAEGLLVGQVGSTVIPIGHGTVIPSTLAGRLFLSINDDMFGIYGAGFTDNEGFLEVELSVGSTAYWG